MDSRVAAMVADILFEVQRVDGGLKLFIIFYF